VDREDAAAELDRRVEQGRIDAQLAENFAQFIRDGYTILPEAVSQTVCENLRTVLATAFRDGSDRLLCQEPGSAATQPVPAGLPPDRMRVVDMHAVMEEARDALFADPITTFLGALFEDDPLLFQSLTFERGSQQGFHQDTAYVVVSSPRELAASWIALEDISAGSGELMYLPGSHRLPEWLFSGEHKHWKAERDGTEQHDEWCWYLIDESQKHGLESATFCAKTGDALIWAADLAHGGSVVTEPEASRRSLVGHYCPNRVDPNYFSFAPQRRTKVGADAGRGFYSSYHVDLQP